jgi:hypothetical protein
MIKNYVESVSDKEEKCPKNSYNYCFNFQPFFADKAYIFKMLYLGGFLVS